MFLKTKLKQSVELLTKQADAFLKRNGFPVDPAHRKLFASYVQLIPGDKDYFYQHQAAAYMRKAISNEAAFFLMHPKKYNEYLEMKKKAEQDEQVGTETAQSSVEQKAQG